MPTNDPARRSYAWSYHLADTFARCGVRHVFISPGSRSTPLAMALADHADLRCHSVLDERAAAFMALGAGKGSGRAALFVCTSGTAAANAFPAVIEARMAHTPLIVLSADRPATMRATGAPQTIDQIKLFGQYPLFFFEAAEPSEALEDIQRLERLAAQSWYHAVETGGPVHLNLPFRKPLEPNRQTRKLVIKQYAQTTGISTPRSIPQIVADSRRTLPPSIITALEKAKRPLVIAGPGFDVYRHSNAEAFDDGTNRQTAVSDSSEYRPHKTTLAGWVQRARIPVLAETGGFRGAFSMHPSVLTNLKAIDRLKPDVVVRIGDEVVHGSTRKALSIWNCEQFVLHPQGMHSDASLSMTQYIPAHAGAFDWNHPELQREYSKYHALWQQLCAEHEQNTLNALSRAEGFLDAHVYATLAPVLTEEPALKVVLSNSLVVRDYLVFGGSEHIGKVPAITNRGASGIDGVTSTATGAALACEQPIVLFTGDLAFLHDSSALNNLAQRGANLRIIIVNNGGGQIFQLLPFEEHDAFFETFVQTPQQADLTALAGAHGLWSRQVSSPDELLQAWHTIPTGKPAIIECLTDPAASHKLRSPL